MSDFQVDGIQRNRLLNLDHDLAFSEHNIMSGYFTCTKAIKITKVFLSQFVY